MLFSLHGWQILFENRRRNCRRQRRKPTFSSFAPILERQVKPSPSCRWQRKIIRGEAAKIEIPLREQWVVGSNPIAPTISNS
jgi:hypothetical protein